MAITQIIATLPAVLNDSETFYEDIAVRNNSLVTVSFPSINTWSTQANDLAVEVNDKAAQVAAQAMDGGYSQDYINSNFFSQDYINGNFFSQDYINGNFIGVNNAQDITEVKTFIASPIVPTPTTGTQVANKDYVDSTAIGIGVGQTWQDMKGSRVAGTTYTNTTERPIQIFVAGDLNAGTITIGGVSMAFQDYSGGSFLNHIIPAGQTYRISSNPNIWAELR